jgi:acyl carrier protein
VTSIQLMEEIKKTLHTDTALTEDLPLQDIDGWDSLASISIVVLFDELFSMLIRDRDVNACKTVGDLLNLAGEYVSK